MTRREGSGGLGAALGVAALVVAAGACCALPALIASGALAAIGGALHNGWVIGLAVMVMLAALAYTVHRHRARTTARHHDGERKPDCCPPTPPHTMTDHHHQRRISDTHRG